MKSNVPAEGIEPTRSCDHWILSPARLPVPPRRREEIKLRKRSGSSSARRSARRSFERILPHSSHSPLCPHCRLCVRLSQRERVVEEATNYSSSANFD